MQELEATLYSGVVLGSMYALMSMGLSLVWGGLRVLNLTQGALYMLGAYTAVSIGNIGLPPILGVLGGFLAMGLLGIAIYVTPVRMLARRADRESATLLATFAVAILLENGALFGYGPRSQDVPGLASGEITLGGVPMSWNSLIMIGTAIVLLTAVAVALKWTRLGLAVRALAQERDGAQISGIGVDATSGLVMFISSGLAGVGGVLLSSYYFVTPYVGDNYLLIALVVTILGGLGSIGGTLAAAFLVGLIQQVTSLYLGVRWSLPVLFGLIMIVLIARPSGLAGKVVAERL
jgi:branched-chain amino acid transport system permease protein